jgi:4-amino-4-deoxy-L-arabinose transferase-like glycosyltransferase
VRIAGLVPAIPFDVAGYAARRMNADNSSRAPWAWLALWCVLLLPLAVLFPPIPVDETRYLTAAWEMYNSGQWLVPTVNGA